MDRDLIDIHVNNYRRIIEEISEERLNPYIYILRDPRDGKVFYVGRGQGTRVLDHLGEALAALDAGRLEGLSAKNRRILEIWSAGEMVDWQIVARRLADEQQAELAEAAVMAALEASQNGPALNQQAGMHAADHGPVLREELDAFRAQPVNPCKAYGAVFVFPVHRAIEGGREPYDATRCCWYVAERWRGENQSVAVGLVRGRSVGAWNIEQWHGPNEDGKYWFEGTALDSEDLANKRWTTIIDAARGFFQRGNWLVVEFNGNGRFRIRRGSANREWQVLV